MKLYGVFLFLQNDRYRSLTVIQICVHTLIHIKDNRIIKLFEWLEDEIMLPSGRLG